MASEFKTLHATSSIPPETSRGGGRRVEIRAGGRRGMASGSETKNEGKKTKTKNSVKLQYCRHKLQKQFALSLDSARQVRHRRLQPRPDPCQDRYCSHDWSERTKLVLSPRSSQSERCQTSPGSRAKWPLPDARSGVDNLTMMCSAEPHMWRLTKHKATGYCRRPAGISALLGIVAFWSRRGRGKSKSGSKGRARWAS